MEKEEISETANKPEQLSSETNNRSEQLSSETDDKSEHISSETAKELDETNEIENLKKVEAALFLSARFLNLNQLIMLTDINPLMLKESIEKLTEKYNSEESAIEIISKKNMWKMDVKQEYVSMINKLATGNTEFTKAEQETLAVIAYKQPVKQSVIIKIRGNKAYDHIKKVHRNRISYWKKSWTY
jgi:chromosome segregation and condensation protein ScpB